ncbi:MAG TPA: glycosyltransferase [Spirochaetales bacterium]|nr:glycosyltransferase [Spirochaetales bacterium]
MDTAPKILMAMLECGFGHKNPAIAVRDAIEEDYPGAYAVEVVDLARESGAIAADELLKRSWDFSLAFPPPARIGYLLVELAGERKEYIDVLFKEFVVKGMAYIDRYRPDLIFSTHPLCTYVAVKAREKLGLAFKLVTYVVDPFDGYSWWAEKGSDYTLVATDRSRDRLLRHGIPPEKIRVIGFPINKKFMRVDADRDEVIARLGLDPDNRTLLVSAGGQGIGRVFSFVEALARHELPLNVITVAGKNRRTKERMDRLVRMSSKTRIASIGYARNMNELVAASDAVVGKAGASTAMEAIFLLKPMIFTEWSTYNDRYIINFALDYHIGMYCPTTFSFIRAMRSVVEDDRLRACAENLAELHMRPGTDDVAAFIAGQLGAGGTVGPDRG